MGINKLNKRMLAVSDLVNFVNRLDLQDKQKDGKIEKCIWEMAVGAENAKVSNDGYISVRDALNFLIKKFFGEQQDVDTAINNELEKLNKKLDGIQKEIEKLNNELGLKDDNVSKTIEDNNDAEDTDTTAKTLNSTDKGKFENPTMKKHHELVSKLIDLNYEKMDIQKKITNLTVTDLSDINEF